MNEPTTRDCSPSGVLKRCPRLIAHLALLMGRSEDGAAGILAEAAAQRAARLPASASHPAPYATRMVKYAISFRGYHREMRRVAFGLCLARAITEACKAAA